MALSSQQRAALEREARRRGIDAAALVREAEALSQDDDAGDDDAPSDNAAKPAAAPTDRPLYQYHLPFVTVNEVRTRWLGLGPVAGGEVYAGEWMAKQAAPKPGDGTP